VPDRDQLVVAADLLGAALSPLLIVDARPFLAMTPPRWHEHRERILGGR
jgi:hypothetical protein